KFTEKGHVVLDVACDTTKGNRVALCISVKDTGIGIPEEKIGSVFNKFEQLNTSTTRKYDGTGIGLSICLELVQLMHGTLTVESEPGQGSVFQLRVVLPRGKEEPLPALPDTSYLKELRVLVVDDNAVVGEIIHDQLVAFGIEVDTCTRCTDALEALQKSAA